MLSGLTTFGTGGPATELVRADNRNELVDAIAPADVAALPVLVLGGGSNLVVSDNGFDGRVVYVATKGIAIRDDADTALITVEAGESWDALVEVSIQNSLAGFEAMSGIPGSVGGAIVQNIGAYGEEVRNSVVSVDVFDRRTATSATLDLEACRFEYRNSAFKRNDSMVVLAATFRLDRSEMSKPIAYAELASRLGMEIGDGAPLQLVRDTVLELRRGKGMVIDPGDPDSRSAGSFFTNPIIDANAFDELCRKTDATPPSWPVGDEMKVSAAWLIGRAGFAKGMKLGAAGISSKHSLALVNTGGATTSQILDLARMVRNGVAESFGIWLEPEPVLVSEQI